MEINPISPSIQSMTDVLRKASGDQGDISESLMKMGAQNTIDINQLETIGKFIDTYV